MSKLVIIAIALCVGVFDAWAQKFVSDSSYVHFFSTAPVENIEAKNSHSKSVVDLSTGELVFSVPIKDFVFEKSLMQEHFNENYLETEKFPTGIFKAKIANWSKFSGEKKQEVKGDLTIHGVTKSYTITGDMTIKENSVIIDTKFVVKLVDHKIQIPQALFYNIAEEIEVTVHFEYKPLNK